MASHAQEGDSNSSTLLTSRSLSPTEDEVVKQFLDWKTTNANLYSSAIRQVNNIMEANGSHCYGVAGVRRGNAEVAYTELKKIIEDFPCTLKYLGTTKHQHSYLSFDDFLAKISKVVTNDRATEKKRQKQEQEERLRRLTPCKQCHINANNLGKKVKFFSPDKKNNAVGESVEPASPIFQPSTLPAMPNKIADKDMMPPPSKMPQKKEQLRMPRSLTFHPKFKEFMDIFVSPDTTEDIISKCLEGEDLCNYYSTKIKTKKAELERLNM